MVKNIKSFRGKSLIELRAEKRRLLSIREGQREIKKFGQERTKLRKEIKDLERPTFAAFKKLGKNIAVATGKGSVVAGKKFLDFAERVEKSTRPPTPKPLRKTRRLRRTRRLPRSRRLTRPTRRRRTRRR